MQNPVWPVYQNTTVANSFLTKQCLNDLLLNHFDLNFLKTISKDIIKSLFICI